jgi:hypothetical protein
MSPRHTVRRPRPPRRADRADHTVVLSDDLGQLREVRNRRLQPWEQVLASWHGFSLDERLAAGASPDGDRLMAARARALVSPARRRKLARDWGLLVRTARAGPTARVQAPLRRDRIVAAEPEIRQLQESLRAALPVPVRGVAMASRLLTDAGGPVYSRRSPVDLRTVLRDAVRHMNPWTALAPDQWHWPGGS